VVNHAGAGPQVPDRAPGRRFRRRELVQGDGTTLVLRADGTIELRAADRTVVRTWRPADPEWGAPAFRFGIRAQEPTVPPRRPVAGSDRPGS
jgi:hypothetical protein